MASRAHVIHDYSIAHPHVRSRRQVWYRHDPVVVPRSSLWRTSGGLIVTALAMAAIVTGSAYAAFHDQAPSLAETPTAPLVDTWRLDPLAQQANVANLLSGPAHAVPSLEGTGNAAHLDDQPLFSDPALSSAQPAEPLPLSPAPSEGLSPTPSEEQPLPGTRTLPYAGPAATTSAVPYPDPVTTPPDVIAPPEATPETPTPALDPDNPYSD